MGGGGPWDRRLSARKGTERLRRGCFGIEPPVGPPRLTIRRHIATEAPDPPRSLHCPMRRPAKPRAHRGVLFFSLGLVMQMSRILELMLALALTIGGAGWLLYQLFVAEDFSSNLVVAALIVIAMGAHWLWTDYVKPRKEGGACAGPRIISTRD